MVQHVDVAIKSYVISILTGSTFDGFIDCTHSVMVKDFNEDWTSTKFRGIVFWTSQLPYLCKTSALD